MPATELHVAGDGNIFTVSTIVRTPAIMWTALQLMLGAGTSNIVQPYSSSAVRVMVSQRLADVPDNITPSYASCVIKNLF